MFEACERFDLVVGNIEDAQRFVGVEAGDGGKGIMGDVKLFQVWKGGEVGDAGNSIGLDR